MMSGIFSDTIDWTAFCGLRRLLRAGHRHGLPRVALAAPRPSAAHLDEWGLGGRNFGTWITWFLVGGDFYTAYTVIAVPALVYAVGAYGFFALPYTIIVYPIVFLIMPRLWRVAHARRPRDGGRRGATAATARAGSSSRSRSPG